MNMKKIFTVFIAAILVTAVAVNLLGGREEEAELLYNGKTYDACLTELKEANAPLSLLKRHDVVSNIMEASDPSGTILGTYRTRYSRTEDGRLLFVNEGTDAAGSEVIVMNGYADENMPGAYYMISGDQKQMMVYPSAEYEAYVANNSALDLTAQGYSEMVIEVKETEGVLEIVSVLQTSDSKEASRVTYFADPETLELQAREILTYHDEDLISQSRTEYTYDSEDAAEYKAADAVLTGDGTGCKLTLTLIEGDAVVETQEFTVDRTAAVSFQSAYEYKMYTDAALKKKLKAIDVTGERADVYVVLETGEQE